MDYLPVFMFFVRMRGLFGVLQLANFAAMDYLPVFMFFCANAWLFWRVAAMDCLPFAFYRVSTATFNEFFFLAGTLTAH